MMCCNRLLFAIHCMLYFLFLSIGSGGWADGRTDDRVRRQKLPVIPAISGDVIINKRTRRRMKFLPKRSAIAQHEDEWRNPPDVNTANRSETADTLTSPPPTYTQNTSSKTTNFYHDDFDFDPSVDAKNTPDKVLTRRNGSQLHTPEPGTPGNNTENENLLALWHTDNLPKRRARHFELTSIRDYEKHEKLPTSTPRGPLMDFNYIWNFPAQAKTCQYACGATRNNYTCDCDLMCSLYESCCSDFQEFCPHIHIEAKVRFSPLIRAGYEMVCHPSSNRYMISGCQGERRNLSDTLRADGLVTDSMLFDYVSHFIPVFDSHIGILFYDLHSLNCFNLPTSEPHFWRLEATTDDLVINKEMAALVVALQEKQYQVFPASLRHDGRRCAGGPRSTILSFSIVSRMTSQSSVEIKFHSNVVNEWLPTSYCAQGANDYSCPYGRCHQNATVKQGSCQTKRIGILTFTHPPRVFTMRKLDDFVTILIHGSQKMNIPQQISVIRRVTRVNDTATSSAWMNESCVSADRYFEIEIEMVSPFDDKTIPWILRDLIAYAYECMGVVTASRILQFTTGAVWQNPNQIPFEESKTTLPTISNTTKNCSVNELRLSRGSDFRESSFISGCIDIHSMYPISKVTSLNCDHWVQRLPRHGTPELDITDTDACAKTAPVRVPPDEPYNSNMAAVITDTMFVVTTSVIMVLFLVVFI